MHFTPRARTEQPLSDTSPTAQVALDWLLQNAR